jgi:hypothetical protein
MVLRDGKFLVPPFHRSNGKQWGIWSTSDLIIAAGIGKFTGGKDPFSMVFTDAVCRGPRRTEQFPTQSPHQKDLLSRWGRAGAIFPSEHLA